MIQRTITAMLGDGVKTIITTITTVIVGGASETRITETRITETRITRTPIRIAETQRVPVVETPLHLPFPSRPFSFFCPRP
jgi:hypothetical protein